MVQLSADRALLARTANGDRRAWEQLRERHALLLFAYACDNMGDPGQADAIVAETFQEAWCSAAEFDVAGDLDPASWLLGLAGRVCRRAIAALGENALPVYRTPRVHVSQSRLMNSDARASLV